MYFENEPKKTLEEQRALIKQNTIKTVVIDGKKVKVIPKGFSTTNKLFVN